MRNIARLVARTIRRHELSGPDDRVAVAVSGGPDSVALAWLLREIAPDAGFSLAGLIHVHHGLRGADADADEAFVRALAARLDLPCEVAHVDIASHARAAHRSIEATARDARYAFFEDAARRLGATRAATGHTLDDQAETVLLRLLRGAGGRGVTGIRVRRGIYIRPLIECRRSELRRYLLARDESFREDATNQDRSIARNRVRHELLPVIEHLAPGGLRALVRFAQISAEDEAFLEGLAIEAARTLVLSEGVLSEGGGVQVKVGGLAGLPAPVARRLVRLVVETAAPGATVTRRHVEAVRLLVAADKSEGHLDLPGASVDRRGDLLKVRAGHPQRAEPLAFELTLPVPGQVQVPAAGATIEASRRTADGGATIANGASDEAVLQAASVTLPLAVRNRRPGDRFRPLGAPGRRKVQDVFVDRKVPRSERDRVPIVVDAAGRIVWVAGLVIADECRVTAPEAGVVILKLRRN